MFFEVVSLTSAFHELAQNTILIVSAKFEPFNFGKTLPWYYCDDMTLST